MGCVASTEGWGVVRPRQLNETLTDRQLELIRSTWEIVARDMDTTGLIIFNRLFEKDKEMKSIFIHLTANLPKRASPTPSQWSCPTDIELECPLPSVHPHADGDQALSQSFLKKHAHVVMEALGAAVECLEDSVFLSNVLVALGQIHCTYNVQPHYLQRMWPAVRYGLRSALQEVYTDEVDTTWRIVFIYIISRMREGIRIEKQQEAGGGFSGNSPVLDDTQW